ncbi:MAG: UvrD-helicase domain-containing protein [Clostridia bacterium]|nr:UvrD-helicase domain-containing protein [Clostridia bacterium]
MNNYRQNLQEETEYLEKTISFIKTEISRQSELLSGRKEYLREAGRDMWENSVHFTKDFEKLTEVIQRLNEVSNQTATFRNTVKQLDRYGKMLKEPYFGRFDFVEEGSGDAEKIYIGLHSAIDSRTHEILIYDWRAPVSGVFYRHELGKAQYNAPFGIVSGEVLLKRQFKIQNSGLKYFFDCSIKIDDEVLQNVLSQNSSAKMRNIVETIQREQDAVIRDTDNELLIVQGVAGSGKTSVALHRIAYLLYHGMNSKISNQNIIIISPNAVFSRYVSDVLPELGEENVNQVTFDELVHDSLGSKYKIETRAGQLEELITTSCINEVNIKQRCIEFKGSMVFLEILERVIRCYERRILTFDDVFYAGRIIETRQRLKNIFLDNKINMPMAKRLKRMESVILDKIHPLQRERIKKIEALVQKSDGHDFDIKPYSRLVSIKETKMLLNRMRRFTEIDYYHTYSMLFSDMELFMKLSTGLELPQGMDEVIEYTRKALENGFITFEDSAAMFLLKLKLEGSESFSGIRHAVIDEAQDYTPVQYAVFKMLFKDARFTVLGDVNQSIEKKGSISLYDIISGLFSKKRWVKIFLNKCYRSSFEISSFSQRLLCTMQDIVPFERHENEPLVSCKETIEDICRSIIDDTNTLIYEGYESIAVICKTSGEAEIVYKSLKDIVGLKLITSSDDEISKGVVVIPAYMAKGLEFDTVIVFNASHGNYNTELDRRLLYIACTRALHRLILYYAEEKSKFIGTACK